MQWSLYPMLSKAGKALFKRPRNVMTDLWKVLAGAAIFILGMNFLEEAVQTLSGRKFKLFLKKHTYRTASAIGIGTLASGVLQSSSVVNLLIMSLTGSGAIPLRNALALILGSNLGTTLNTWILSSMGFRFDISTIAFPAIAVACFSRMLIKNKAALYSGFSCLLGLGFVMLGLEFIKAGMKDSVDNVNLVMFRDYPAVIYFVIGLFITALLQSSAAAVAIVLSALHSSAIGFYAAMAMVLGSEIGTTLKFLLVSYGREASVKRVALGNFLFNLLNAILILTFLHPLSRLIAAFFFMHDPLIALAFFQTLINIIAIIVCSPLLSLSERYLKKIFAERLTAKYLSKVPVPDIELAIAALEQETCLFLETVLQYAANIMDYGKVIPFKGMSALFLSQNPGDQYRFIKEMHGNIYKYYISIQKRQILATQAEGLDRLISSAREGIFAAKNLHDMERDIRQLRNSANEVKYRVYLQARELLISLLSRLVPMIQTGRKAGNIKSLTDACRIVQANDRSVLGGPYITEASAGLSEIEISTVINFNREFFNALYAILECSGDILLSDKEKRDFEDLMEKETDNAPG